MDFKQTYLFNLTLLSTVYSNAVGVKKVFLSHFHIIFMIFHKKNLLFLHRKIIRFQVLQNQNIAHTNIKNQGKSNFLKKFLKLL